MLRLLSIFGAVFYVVAAPRSGTLRGDVHQAAEYVISNGYIAETHQAVTEDGYILTMLRIPYARGLTAASVDRPVVFVMHGLYGAATNFIYRGPELSIGYHLADAGFDVWFGNARGNINSRAHVTLDPDHPDQYMDFFDFTWEEIGLYDLPAMIEYALDHTGQEKLHYVGHSQGGTVFLVLGSMRPDYIDEKLASVHLLAGVGYQDYFPNDQLTSLAMITDLIYAIITEEGIIEVNAELLELIGDIVGGGEEEYSKSDFCFGDIKYRYLCQLVGMKQILREDEPGGLLNAGLGGGSVKQIAHYGQNVRDKLFRRYHYGTSANQALYGSPDPPLYDLSLITVNVTMHYTVSDVLLDERDVLAMAAVMPNTVVRKIARDSFLHEDFIQAEDAKELVTDFIIEAIQYVHDQRFVIDASGRNNTLGENVNEQNEVILLGWDRRNEGKFYSPAGTLDTEDSEDNNDIEEVEVAVESTPAPTVAPIPVTDAGTDISLNSILRFYVLACIIYSML